MTRSPLERLMAPRAIAIVGASPREETVGFRIIRNLRRLGFTGSIYPVNPRYAEVAGLPCYPSIAELPADVDAAFLATAADPVAGLLEDVGARGIPASIINASGFADGGPEGEARQARIQAIATAHGIALHGPNSMGLVNVHDRVGLWTGSRFPVFRPGPVAVISQSGSVGVALSQDERSLGLAYVVSVGNEAVLTASRFLHHVVADDRVRVVMMFLETLRDPEVFAAAADEAHARGKPIVAVKVGRTEGGRAAVTAHTGALSGEDEVYGAFFRRHQVIRARDLDEMIETAALLSVQPAPPRSSRVVGITLSGGEAALIADLSAETGVDLPALGPATLERVREVFPVFSVVRNPIDMWGVGYDTKRFCHIVQTLRDDPSVGVIMVAVDSPASGGADAGIATEMATACRDLGWSTDPHIVLLNNTTGVGPNPEVAAILAEARIPYLCGMREALAAIGHWTRRSRREHAEEPATSAVTVALRDRLREVPGLAEPERFQLLRDAGIRMVDCRAVGSEDEAAAQADRLGYPVALKGSGPGLAHKSDLDLVRLGLATPAAVRAAFRDVRSRLTGADSGIVLQPMAGPGVELIVGARNDPRFGTVVVVGLGGILVETMREASVRLGPVDRTTALEMLAETRAGALLAGVRGKGPHDADAAAEAIAALSRLAAAAPDALASIEINPLIVLDRGRGAVGVDVLLEPHANSARSR